MGDQQREEVPALSMGNDADKEERGSPKGHDRRRSRSPRRDRRDDRPRKKDTGFRWKEKRRDDDTSREEPKPQLQRGYRDHYRPRSRSPRPRSPRREEVAPERTEAIEQEKGKEEREKKEKKKVKKIPAAAPTQPMIIVYVNDRLGTKKAVPCFATDPIKDFKVIVASMIGRQPHEILLKRQGERPFKDQLTLQDYGVSNNVQLDLEVDTGD